MRRLLLAIVFALVVGVTAAQPTPQPPASLVAQIEALEQDTEDIRGLTLSNPVERVFPSRDAAALFIAGQLEDPATRALYEDIELVYKSFDLLAPNVDLVAALQRLLEAQIGGYYDPETKEMNTLLISGGVLADRLPLLEQIVYVHEFTHALQDDNFDLFELMGGEDEIAFNAQFPDMALARISLIEGDATEVMTQYTILAAAERPGEMLRDLAALTGLISTLEIPPGTPKILEQELTFPYVQGQVFVQRLLDRGGWRAVNAAYARPPVSSEQIINPTKYFENDLPHPVVVADVASTMDSGWMEAFHRTGGEFFLRRYLETQLSAFEVAGAAGGWGGDDYRFYVNEEMQQTAWVWRLSWDTLDDATQFSGAALNFLNARFPESSGGFAMCWSGPLDAMCFGQIDGDAVLTKAPTLELATAMRDAAVLEN